MKSNAPRLAGLDGIRGLAALLVIVYHTELVKTGGPLAVDLFFILCGFLMAYLYPTVKSPRQFITKRYWRIFPLFVTVCTFSMVQFINPGIPFLWQIIILFILAVTIHFLFHLPAKNKIVIALLFLQLTMITINILVGRLTLPQFNQLLPVLRQPVIYLGNLTLTLWAGWNIPILSGPYWSLAPEIFFYLFYPFITVYVIQFLRKKNLPILLIFLIVMAPLLWAINGILNHILALSRFNIIRAYGFVVGIAIAVTFRNNHFYWNDISKIFRHRLMDIVALLVIPAGMYWLGFFPVDDQTGFIHTLTAGLLIFLVVSSLVEGSLTNRLLQWPILRFFGLISYPAYLIHQSVIDELKKIMTVNNVADLLIFTLVTMFITVPVAAILHWLLERPYFQMKDQLAYEKK